MNEPFRGFGPDAIGFLEGLEQNNSKDWFDANRSTYDEQLAGPMKSLVVAIGDGLQQNVSPGIQAVPKVGKSLFRINRDLRFSKDPSPYHTYVDAVFWEGESPRTSPCFLLRISPDGVVTGAGAMGWSKEQLARWRDAVAGPAGQELEFVLARTSKAARGSTASEPTRVRVPKPYPADHPRADLLRRDGLHVSATDPVPVGLTSARFADWCVTRYVKYADLHRWLVANVGG